MNIKALGVIAAIAVSSTASAAMAQAAPKQEVVTPEQVLKIPVGTKYVAGASSLTRTAQGFNFSEKDAKAVCNNVTKAGGRGNATINCTTNSKLELRFEWININNIKAQGWDSMAAKAGQTQNKPPKYSATLVKQ